ncbi:MAG TPA: threonine dehydratase, partial [Rhodobacteraceae bacterium]|nr:threonine dehydratase [Paracoccaceae bacterium]
MPVTTPQQKIQKTRMFGGDAVEIHMVGDYFDDTLAAAQDWCAREGGHFLSPFDDDDVIEGQASIAVEIEEQMEGMPDHVLLPVGGGGMSAGVSTYFGDRTHCLFV